MSSNPFLSFSLRFRAHRPACCRQVFTDLSSSWKYLIEIEKICVNPPSADKFCDFHLCKTCLTAVRSVGNFEIVPFISAVPTKFKCEKQE